MLLLRAWSETGDPADVRVRVLGGDPWIPGGNAYAVGSDEVCNLIRQWLLGLTIASGTTETPQ